MISQLSNSELLKRYGSMSNPDSASRAVAESVADYLRGNYSDLRVRQYTELEMVAEGLIFDDYEPVAKGHEITQKIKGQLGKSDEKVLARSTYSNHIHVFVNDKEVVDVCEDVAKQTGGLVKVILSF